MSCSISRIVSFSSSRICAHELRQRLGFLRVHAGGRLVEQQQPRLGRQRPGDLHPPLVPVRQLRGEPVEDGLAQADVRQQLAGPLACLPAPRGGPRAGGRSTRTAPPASARGARSSRSRRRSSRRTGGCSGRSARRRTLVITSGRARVMSRSPSRIRPSVGRYSPVSMLNSVVFPAPFGPISDTIECCGTSNETSLTATSPPNAFVTCSARRTLTAAGGAGVSVELTSDPRRCPASPRAGRPPRRSRP